MKRSMSHRLPGYRVRLLLLAPFLVLALLLLLFAGPTSAGNRAGGGPGGRLEEKTLILERLATPKPKAKITKPSDNAVIREDVQVEGTATCPDFSRYTLAYAPSDEPGDQTRIAESTTPVTNGFLGTWQTSINPDGAYLLTLTVYSSGGPVATDTNAVTIDNDPPLVSFSSPTDGEVVNPRFGVTGTVADSALKNWKLESASVSPRLLCHMDGNTVNERTGNAGTLKGTPTYEEGRFSSGIRITAGQGLSFAKDSNIYPQAGSIEMWVTEEWPEGDVENHVLLQTRTTDVNNPMNCLKLSCQAGALTFTAYDEAGNPLGCSMPLSEAGVTSGTPFHVSANWDSGAMNLAVNGFPSSPAQGAGTGVLSDIGRIYIGYYPGTGDEADACLDELSVYSYPRPLVSTRVDVLSDTPKNMGSGKLTIAEGTEPVEGGPLGEVNVADKPGELLDLHLKAKDHFNRTSDVSENVLIDNPLPLADITSPVEGEDLTGITEITGTAFDMDLSGRTLSFKAGSDPEGPGVWTQISSSIDPAWSATLASWDTGSLPAGDCCLRLEVRDIQGKTSRKDLVIHVVHPVELERIVITPDFKAVEHGSSFQFSAKGYDSEGHEVPIDPEWSCDAEVGTIDSSGLFTASGWGTRDVTASVGQVTGTATVSVPSVLSGTLTEDTTLTKRRNPWVITSPVTIPNGVTLTIEPGVVIKSYCWAQASFIVEGKLEASGVVRDEYGTEISVDPIIMTSFRDDSLYGDTNGDGISKGYPGDWGGPIFLNQDPGEFSTLERVELRYGGNTYYGDTPAFIIAWGSHRIRNCTFRDIYSWGARITDGSSTIDNCLFENTTNGLWLEGGTTTVANCRILTSEGEPHGNGIVISAGSPTVTDNTIENMRVGIKVDTSSAMPDPTITNNTITGCSAEAIIHNKAKPHDVTVNKCSTNEKNAIVVGGEYQQSSVWNASNTGTQPSSSGMPWLVTSTVTIKTGTTLTIQSGTVVKSTTWAQAGIIANGALTCGQPDGARVTITSYRDDSVWGDTDGTPGSQGEPGDWGGLSLRGITEPSVLTRTDIKNAGSIYYPDSTAIVTVDGSHTLSECTISRSWSWGMIVSAGSPTIERTDITDTGNGIALCGGTPQVLGCTIRTNGTPQGDGIVISGGSPVIKEFTLGDTERKTTIDHMRKGIRVDTSASMPHPGIENCEITNCSEEAILLSNCPPGGVRNNQGWGNGRNQIKVTGGYSMSTSWPRNAGANPDETGLPFYVTSPITVEQGNTLTIESGACAKFYTPGPPSLVVQGSLRIGSSGGERVKLTSWRDDSVWGDTDGTPDHGYPGDWGGLTVDSETQSTIHSCDMAYGGHYDPQQGFYLPFIDIKRGSHLISGCTVSEPREKALRIESGDSTVTGSLVNGPVEIKDGSSSISGSTVDGLVTVWGSGNPSILNCDLVNGGLLCASNGEAQVRNCRLDGGLGLTFVQGRPHITDNHIKNSTTAISIGEVQPSELLRNTGSQNQVNGIHVGGTYRTSYAWNASNRDSLEEEALPFVVIGEGLTIEETATLTMESEVVIKGDIGSDGVFLNVKGDLEYDTSSHRQVFTSIHDDDYWGDTDNGSGQRQAGDLGCLTIDTTSELDLVNVDLFFAGHGTEPGIKLIKGNHTVSGCNVLNGGILVDSAGQSTIDHTGISGADYGIRANAGQANMNSNQIAGCFDGILLDKGDRTATANIDSNVIQNCQFGINVVSCDGPTTISWNTINNCGQFLGNIMNDLEKITIFHTGGEGSRVNGFELGDVNLQEWTYTLCPNDVPYTLTTGDLEIPVGCRVQVKSGVVIKCKDFGIEVDGAFESRDTSGSNPIITSAYDPFGSPQTINNGEAPREPSYNDWTGISFSDKTRQSGCVIEDTYVSYGGGWDGLIRLTNTCVFMGLLELHNGEITETGERVPRGIGVKFAGNCPVQFTSSDINDCDYAVVCNYREPLSQVDYPTINACRLYRDNWGIDVEPAPGHGLYEYQILDAQNNWWVDPSIGSIENGPFPSGDGSKVNDFDAVDVLPWQGLEWIHAQDDDDPVSPEVSIISGMETPNPGVWECLEHFPEYGVKVRDCKFSYDQGVVLHAGERDMRDYLSNFDDPRTQGQDPLWFDNADLGIFNGHTTLDAFGDYHNQPTPVYSRLKYMSPLPPRVLDQFLWSTDFAWGDQDLEWVLLQGCMALGKDDLIDTEQAEYKGYEDALTNPGAYASKDDLDERLGPQTIWKGLHMLMGYATQSLDEPGLATVFIDYLTRPDAKKVREAFLDANKEREPHDLRNVGYVWDERGFKETDPLPVVYCAESCAEEYFWGRVSGPSEDPGPNAVTKLFEAKELNYPVGVGVIPSASIGELTDPSGTYTASQSDGIIIHGEPGRMGQLPFDDLLFGDRKGIMVFCRKIWPDVLDPGTPFRAGRIDDQTVLLYIDPNKFDADAKYQIGFMNMRTGYWGYLKQDLIINP